MLAFTVFVPPFYTKYKNNLIGLREGLNTHNKMCNATARSWVQARKVWVK